MNEQDKAFARKALEAKTLTIEQVQVIRTEVDRSGRSFEAVASAMGLLAPKPKAPPPPPKAAPSTPLGTSPRPKAAAPAPPPAPARPQRIPLVYLALLGASLLIFVGLLAWTLSVKGRVTQLTADEAFEIAQRRKESDRTAVDASRGYKRERV